MGGDNVVFPNGYTASWHAYIEMELVGKGVDPMEGENGYAATTWLQRGNVVDTHYMQVASPLGDPNKLIAASINNHGMPKYTEIPYRAYWAQLYEYWFPKDLKPYLRNVIKYTEGLDQNGIRVQDVMTIETLWSPSAREILASSNPDEGYTNYGTWTAVIGKDGNEGTFKPYETLGPIYDSYYAKVAEEYNSDNNIALRAPKNNTFNVALRTQGGYWWSSYNYVSYYQYYVVKGAGSMDVVESNSRQSNPAATYMKIGFCI